ncbi:copper chaperone PCu(A)C [Cereibacter sp. SYSU M97828]|nr:copper chaperone PCu(A)C [Cereibacter flavus]
MKALTLAAAVALFALPAQAHDGIHVEDPYLLVAAPAAKTAAAFMRIVNHSGEPDRLVSARSDAAEVVQTHTHSEVDGVMRMRHAEEGFAVEGHAERVLDRSGDHLMLMGLTRPLKPGETVTIELTFERGEVIDVEMPVTDKTPEGASAGHHHH